MAVVAFKLQANYEQCTVLWLTSTLSVFTFGAWLLCTYILTSKRCCHNNNGNRLCNTVNYSRCSNTLKQRLKQTSNLQGQGRTKSSILECQLHNEAHQYKQHPKYCLKYTVHMSVV